MLEISELRKKLYEKYSRKQIANKLNLSQVQISRILNKYSNMSIEKYKILEDMIK